MSVFWKELFRLQGMILLRSIAYVTPQPNGSSVTTHGNYRLAPQTKTSLSSALWPHSCASGKTTHEVSHPKIAPHQARLTMELLAKGLPRKEDAPY